MASSSLTSSTRKRFKYDVYVSFRREDTPKNFVAHLYDALHQQGIKTYKDYLTLLREIQIESRMIKALEDSRFVIVVLSKNYASSSWCLNELVKIMECRMTKEQTVYPVYYDVDPSELRKQSGAVGEAFAKHEMEEAAGKWREALKEAFAKHGMEETAGKWREALKEAANLAGREYHPALGDEAEFIRIIVEDISSQFASELFIDENVVGMKTRMKDVMRSLKSGSDYVHMIGIYGMAGAGKTTLARAIFDRLSIQFQAKSFVENVGEVSDSFSGLKSLQEKVLSNLLNDQHIAIYSVHEGKNMMQMMLRDKKVLLVLDNVDRLEQLEALAGKPSWFKLGSIIIMTTRDEAMLRAHGLSFIHPVNLLSDEEAICLFSRHAFGKDIPIQDYEKESLSVVRYARGLPLTIKVLGSFLCGKGKPEWIDAIERLKRTPYYDRLKITYNPRKILKLSYESLEDDYKEIFLDVACFLKGCDKEKAITLLECCGFHARNGLRVLEQKSLIITIKAFQAEYIDMHNLIEEMGKTIVFCLHPDEPYKRSRLWNQEEIEDILANDLGTEATKAIAVDSPVKLGSKIVSKGFGSLINLRSLCVISEIDDDCDVKNDKFSTSFPNALKFLSWVAYPHSSLPKTFQTDNLVALEMPHSRIMDLLEGEERKVFYKLKFIDLSHSKLRTLDLGLTPNLERLSLKECHDLRSLKISQSKLMTLDLGMTPNLEVLELKECHDLKTLHSPVEFLKLKSLHLSQLKLSTFDLRLTPNLEKLSLEECHDLIELHIPVICAKLTSLELSRSKLSTFDLSLTPILEKLSLEKCHDLVELHMSVELPKLTSLKISHSKLMTLDLGMTPNLKVLELKECHDLKKLHMPVEFLTLRSVDLSQSKWSTFDLRLTPILEKLSLEECNNLVELHMSVECLMLTSLKLHHLKLGTLDLSLTPNLETLDLQDCYHLAELHMPIGCLKRLVFLNISGCSKLDSFLFIKELESLEVLCLNRLYLKEFPDVIPRHCFSSLLEFQLRYNDIDRISSSIENLQKLVHLDLHSCRKLTSLPATICRLRHLRSLKLYGCSLEELPENIDRLECLEKLNLSFASIKVLPESVCKLKYLKTLNLSSCWNLEKLPQDIGGLESLEKLILTECTQVRDIPGSICKLKCLKYFSVLNCIHLQKLPEELQDLKSLEELHIKGTRIRHLPQSISLLTELKIYGPKSGIQFRY